MNNRQTAVYEASKRVRKMFATFDSEFSSILDLLEEKGILDTEILGIEAAIAIQATDTKGEAQDKELLKETMAKTVQKFALRGKVKAHRMGNVVLEEELNHGETYYLKPDAETSYGRAMATKEAIKTNLTFFDGIITADDVIAMEKSIQLFKESITKPAFVKKETTNKGTEKIEKLIIQATETLDNIGDLIHSYFPDSAISREFDNQRKLQISGMRHNHLIIHVEDSETKVPITGVKGTNVNTHKVVLADEEGQVVFSTIKAGKNTIMLEAEGYISQTITAVVTRSTTTELVVELEPDKV
jgi:hypothetical protein